MTTNCLRSGDVSRWNRLYATQLGMMDRATQLQTRDGNLNPRPLGLPLEANVTIRAYEFYAQDVWRATPSLTLTYGLGYQVQVPPTERDGLQAVMVYRDTQEPAYLDSYYRRRAEAAQRGEIFNPEIAYAPIRHVAAQDYVYNIDWNNFMPRLAAAWNPASNNWFFGDRKTVIRGGYGVTYTRMNGVGLVMTPILGVGLGEILACRGPNTMGACTGARRSPSDSFRVGVDGAGVSLPAPAPARIPFPVAAPFGETRSFMIDPGLKLGKAHSFDVTWQRELPGNLVFEIGYVGRVGRNLTQSTDFYAVPFFMRDPASGTTLAQAFDFDNIQVQINNLTTDGGFSDYHAGFISLHKRLSHGLTFDLNYTLSNSTDSFGLN
ncbi:MAG: TonB-dependent receptor [Acidobacteria bacterium]|nr:TonB-dependent receptor [Acidobacteriota bacterium]